MYFDPRDVVRYAFDELRHLQDCNCDEHLQECHIHADAEHPTVKWIVYQLALKLREE